ncbi:methylmalonyl Co-A mutase-associated GTPase MeaB [Candidatus Acetothermia bacterium]|nr:methylmalonyl Co-A mutase-associated GTPase MeaB [Candidatus Acetothermia bacterium]MBI3642834.1 methylmalonyl Co-A mutase-associated GTPase MeaB [Candidatus Acetothermia bacterium]
MIEQQIDAMLGGDSRALSKLISQVEDRDPGYQDVMDRIYSHTGKSYRVGITGPPGAGKSTLVDRLVPLFRQEGKRVGVLACDPTSPFSGGALLGDRVRMQSLLTDDGVFIRSLATRGSLGGLSQVTHEVALLLEAAHYDVIIFETIGVGQAEIDIIQTADSIAVVVIPQSGDAIQAIKAGLMEIADIFVLNKSDQGQADRAVHALHFALPSADGKNRWVPPIVKTVASQNEGMDKFKTALDAHHKFLGDSGIQRKQRERLQLFIQRIIEENLRKELWSAERAQQLSQQIELILQGKLGPFQIAKEIQKGLR